GPDNTRQLVGPCSNHDVEGPSGDQAIDPCPEAALTTSREPDQRSSTVHELSAQITVTPFADSEQPLPAAGCVLTRGETEPRGKAPAAGEGLRVHARRHHRCCDHWADAGDCGQPLGGLVAAGLVLQTFVELGDPRLDC